MQQTSARHFSTERQPHKCTSCGARNKVSVEIDKWSGETAWTCPDCETTQEANPTV